MLLTPAAIVPDGPPHSFVVESSQRIESGIENVWRRITDVDLSVYPHPAMFKVLG
jgi:hypothetical protein